jgi:cytochrome c
MRSTVFFAAMSFAALVLSEAFAQDGDAAAGATVFNKCKACHEVETDRNKVGPTLMGIMGKTAGTHEGFRYSKAMIEAGENGLVWDEETLGDYLKDPRGMVKGTKMAFPGLKKDEEIADVIAYLEQFSEESGSESD